MSKYLDERTRHRQVAYRDKRRRTAWANPWSWGEIVSGGVSALILWEFSSPTTSWRDVWLPFLAVVGGILLWHFLIHPIGRYIWSVPEAEHYELQRSRDELVAEKTALESERDVLKGRLTPKFTIREVIRETTPTQNPFTGAAVGFESYVQLLPKCLTDSPVDECQGHLLNVSKWDGNTWQPTEMNEPLFLNWSMHTDKPHLPITLHPDVPQRLNVLKVGRDDGRILPCTHVSPLRFQDVFVNATDTFKFNVKVTAKHCEPVNVSLKIKLGPQWDKPEILELL